LSVYFAHPLKGVINFSVLSYSQAEEMTVERAFLQQRKIIKFWNCFVIIQAEKVLVYYCFPLKR
jgi:hypothetical protein